MRLILLLVLTWTSHALAAIETYSFENTDQEKRYQSMITELRCLVCQNQNLADSNADLAKDLRAQTHAMIIAGKADADIVDYMVERYGDFVLYRPPFKASTWLLWVGPFLILLIALVVFSLTIRKNRQAPQVSESERRHASELLDRNS
ncbi:MAG: cytochrome c-type biogenesis protein [Gammaproteobacteria bacterium]|jgi:cytochrome c-type biogenesis protein CcmH